MKKLCFLLPLMVAILLVQLFSSSFADPIPDSRRREVEEEIERINQKIREKGYRWRAGVTSMSYLSHEEIRGLYAGCI